MYPSRTAKSHQFGMTARSHALTLHMNFSCKVFILASSEINNKILKRRNSAKAKMCSVLMCAVCGGVVPIMCKRSLLCLKIAKCEDNKEEEEVESSEQVPRKRSTKILR